MNLPAPIPVLVLGCPRSGTTLIGSYVGSADRILDLGEYGAFYLTYRIVPEEMEGMPARFGPDYLASLREHARRFAARLAADRGCAAYCDSTPLNLLVARELLEDLPEAAVVLMVRSPAGVIQSLGRSYREGYEWAGRTLEERAWLYRLYYRQALELPRDRLVVVGYDDLCRHPGDGLKRLDRGLRRLGVDVTGCDPGILARSHATDPVRARPRLARLDEDGLVFTPIPPHGRVRWTPEQSATIRAVVGGTVRALRRAFPEAAGLRTLPASR